MPRTGKSLPLLLAGLVGAAAWQNRSRLGQLLQSVKGKVAAASGDALTETIPDDYDRNRPSVFNSTAMAGPRDTVAAPTGFEGGTMGTTFGTQGDGAI